MEILISGTDGTGSRDLAQLRGWLDAAGPGAPWRLAAEPAPPGGTLGAGVDEICAIVTAAAAIPDLVGRVRDWFGTRSAPGPVHLTIMLDPADPADQGEPRQSPDERLA
jgi:hypothetical protein